MHQSASTVVYALSARSAVGVKSASTVVCALSARSAVGHRYASTVVCAISARSAVVHQSASTVVYALIARSAVGHKYASTVVGAICARSAKRARNEATKTRRRNTPSTSKLSTTSAHRSWASPPPAQPSSRTPHLPARARPRARRRRKPPPPTFARRRQTPAPRLTWRIWGTGRASSCARRPTR